MIEIEYELYHYGVKGMKWGKRKQPDPAKARYKQAKKDWRRARWDFYEDRGLGIGIKGIAKYEKAEAKRNKADMDFVSEKARYKGRKSEKAEMRTYVNEMSKQGLAGSAADRASGGRSKRLYDRITRDKGKAYADKVIQKTQNKAIAEIVGGVTASVGVAVVSGILMTRT